jgi:hypothetical protein
MAILQNMKKVLAISLLWVLSSLMNVSMGQDLSVLEYSPDSILIILGDELNQEIDLRAVDMRLLHASVWLAMNEARAKKKALPLKFDESLYNSAKAHACHMAEQGWFSHTDKKNKGHRTMEERITLYGFEGMRISENLAKTWVDPEEPETYREFGRRLIEQWMSSAPHKEIMLEKELVWSGLGLCFEPEMDKYGYYYILAVQTFGTKWDD